MCTNKIARKLSLLNYPTIHDLTLVRVELFVFCLLLFACVRNGIYFVEEKRKRFDFNCQRSFAIKCNYSKRTLYFLRKNNSTSFEEEYLHEVICELLPTNASNIDRQKEKQDE